MASIKFMLLTILFESQGTHSLYDGTVFLNGHHKRKLKEEFGEEH